MTDNPQESPFPISTLALAFPPSRPARYASLVVRIDRYGFRPPVIVWRGEIIFGVELLKAYTEAGVAPIFEHLPEDADPVETLAAGAIPVLEMDNNQRGVSAYLLSQWSTRGRPRAEEEKSANLRNITQEDSARLYGVGVRLVTCAAQVLSEDSKAVPALRQVVREWRVKASDAARVVSRPAEVQERAVALVIRKEARTVKAAVERVEREIADAEVAAALADMLAKPMDETVTLHVARTCDLLRLVPAGSVDAVITHPPHDEDKLLIYSDLANVAAHALKPEGFMAVVGSGMLLPQMLKHLEHEGLRWIMEADVFFRGPPARSGRPYFLSLHRRPLLIYGKPAFRPFCGDDVIEVPPPDALPPGLDQNEVAMRMIMEKLCRPGQTVCDPVMLDRAGTALAARRNGCTFIGATEQQPSRDRIRKRLEDGGKPAFPDGDEDPGYATS